MTEEEFYSGTMADGSKVIHGEKTGIGVHFAFNAETGKVMIDGKEYGQPVMIHAVVKNSELVPFDYVAEAHVTLSPEFHADRVSWAAFRKAVNDAIDALNALDKVKKSLFYGRDNNLSAEGLAGCEDLPRRIVYASARSLTGGGTEVINDQTAIDFVHGVIGAATETGEMLELLRNTYNGHTFDRTNLKEEVGDAKWYLAILASVGGFMWGDDEQVNIAKLRARFPDKFTEYDANNRRLAAERAILEGDDAANQLALPISQREKRMEGEMHIPPERSEADKAAALARYESSGGYVPEVKNPNLL
jgi:hypothetical protein